MAYFNFIILFWFQKIPLSIGIYGLNLECILKYLTVNNFFNQIMITKKSCLFINLKTVKGIGINALETQ